LVCCAARAVSTDSATNFRALDIESDPFLSGSLMLDDLVAHNLRIGLFRFTIAPVHPLEVPAVNKGNMLRGGFGHAFRRLCCIPQCKDTKTCPLAASCPYKTVFEPSPQPNADRLSKNQDVPRPFVFRAPHTQQTRFNKSERFEFGLVLIGRALDFLPYFVLSFRELTAEGLGLNRAKCTLENVEEIGPSSNGGGDCTSKLIYSARDQTFRAIGHDSANQWIKTCLQRSCSTNGGASTQRVTIRFVTPTFLRADGEVVRRPEFHHVFKRLRDRINALNTFFGDGPLDLDFRGLGERAERVRTVSAQIDWVERFRTSSKTRQRHELSGFVGEATYEGELSEFLPWLALGELVHVGKHTAWGNGWIELGKTGTAART
jgi:CRISPR/Cas system endoribonuclease Cas6 (RAMP superfamily)